MESDGNNEVVQRDPIESNETPTIDQTTQKGKKLTSKVWLDMERETLTDGTIKATCKHCKSVLTALPKSGTSHLKRHIKGCSAKQYHDIKIFCITGSGSTPALSGNAIVNPMKMTMPVPSLDAIREALVVMFVACAQSFSLVEAPGLKYFMSVLAPQFSQLSRATLQRDAISQYKNQKVIVAEEMQNAPGRICFTSDNWRSEHTTDEFMCITAHWIDINWKLQKRIIKFGALTPQLDGASLADEVLICLGEWKIADKVFSFTLDNASYNDTMMASLRSCLLKKQSLVKRGDFFHLRCSCHIINLVVHAGLKVIDDVVLKIRRIVILLRHSMPKNKKFYEVVVSSYGLTTTKKLRLDTPTRWNSTYIMLDRYLFFRDAIDNFVAKDPDLKAYVLNEEEWEKIAQLRKFLKVFYDVTNEFSASKTPTANVYFHGVWKIHKLLTKYSSGSPILSNMVIEMKKKFEKYWDDYSLLLSCAAVLDPRKKLVGVGFLYEKLYGDVYANEMVYKIKNTLLGLLEEYKSKYGGSDFSGSVGIRRDSRSKFDKSDFDSDSDDDSESDGESYEDFMNKKMRMEINSELDVYLNEKHCNTKEGFDILEHWKHEFSRFVVLSAVARDILSVPISTVPSESSFSLGKKIITSSRSSLASTTIEALACYEDWLRATGFGPGPTSMFRYGNAPRVVDEDD